MRNCPPWARKKTSMRFENRWAAAAALVVLTTVAACSAPKPEPSKPQAANPNAPAAIDRTVLPIQEPIYPPITELDARNVTPPPPFEVKAPAGAPNVVVVLIDDMGFGMSSAFGGPIHMPTVERLANDGLRYNQFHTTALCSPTRAALLSGRNHHVNNMGSITETATAFPGNTGRAAEQRRAAGGDAAPQRLQHGASSASPTKRRRGRSSPSGPTDRWPTRSGFDKFYGFIGGETNQWAPFLYDGMTPVEVPKDAELSLHDGHDRPGDRVDAVPEVADAGQALLHVLRAWRDPRAAPCAEGVDRQVQGQVRRRAGTRCAKRRWRARSSWAWSRRAPSSPRSPRRSRTGTR